MSALQKGKLYIVATPIGNLGDMTFRAVEILKKVNIIAAEDTRHSRQLLAHYGINNTLVALHDFNEEDRAQFLIQELNTGKDIALISDAGTPLISDPGYVLVAQARTAGIVVSPIPGPCAAITGLSAAGLPTHNFIFAGFLPNKSSARKSQLEAFINEESTLIFYEAPHRVKSLLTDLATVFGDEREVVIARELTKTFETFYAGKLQRVIDEILNDTYGQTGEFVVMVKGKTIESSAIELSEHAKKTITLLAKEVPIKQAAKLAAEITGESKNLLYDFAVKNLKL